MPLAAFSLFGHENMGTIPSSRVFPALSFFGMLVDPLISLPQLLRYVIGWLFNELSSHHAHDSAVVLAATSWSRIYSFLLADEKTSTADSSSSHSVMNIGHAITIVDGAFSWTALDSNDVPPPAQVANDNAEIASIDKVDEDEVSGPVPFLHNVNLSIRRGSLTAIVGNVGSGKSSLLSAIIGEMMRVSGEVFCNGSVAYCAQQPWVQTSTIQDNVLFGRPLDIRQLQKAIQTTCFDSDLETFPHGMATQMSEKGNNLSGGQKARLALSRAVYSDADIYLFDDILSALDPRVGRTVFNNCIRHALQGKTRVLVTHQLQYLNQVDHIIVVSDGTIVEQGSFDDLVASNGELTRLLSDVQTTSESGNHTKKDEMRKSTSGPPKAMVEREETTDQIIAEEERNTGAVDAVTWWAYLKATGGVGMIIMLLLEIILLQSSVVILSQWLTWWTEDTWHEKAGAWIGIYNGIGFASVLAIGEFTTSFLYTFEAHVYSHPQHNHSHEHYPRQPYIPLPSSSRCHPCSHVVVRESTNWPHHEPFFQGHRIN
jgi:ATP-binding cassette subfamily C (CFTR/MRP) protein 1